MATIVDYCRFGIDGVGDTNEVYRRNTNFTRILESIKSFVASGGRGEWDFLVFRHNEHQADAARELARDLGLTAFNVKATSRFLSPSSGQVSDSFPILNEMGRIIFVLQPPNNPDWRNPIVEKQFYSSNQESKYLQYLEKTKISCKAAKAKSLFMTAEGFVTPCCWLGSFYRQYNGCGNGKEFLDHIGRDTSRIDPRVNRIESIIDGPVFQKIIPDSWDETSVAGGRIEHCARICGARDFQGAQHFSSRTDLRTEFSQEDDLGTTTTKAGKLYESDGPALGSE